MHKDKIWLNIGRRFFISKMMKFGSFSEIQYCIDTICGHVFHKRPVLIDMSKFMNYQTY